MKRPRGTCESSGTWESPTADEDETDGLHLSSSSSSSCCSSMSTLLNTQMEFATLLADLKVDEPSLTHPNRTKQPHLFDAYQRFTRWLESKSSSSTSDSDDDDTYEHDDDKAVHDIPDQHATLALDRIVGLRQQPVT